MVSHRRVCVCDVGSGLVLGAVARVQQRGVNVPGEDVGVLLESFLQARVSDGAGACSRHGLSHQTVAEIEDVCAISIG